MRPDDLSTEESFPSDLSSRTGAEASCQKFVQSPSHFSQASGRFVAGPTIGSGSMGQVFVANDLALERSVAVKILKQELVSDPIWVERFVREARANGRLEHPNIPAIHELGRDDQGRPFFTMKLVKGQTLQDLIHQLARGVKGLHSRFSFHRRAQLMQSLCDAIHFAHENGVYHRDIKPQNIMVGEHGEVQLLDWGASHDCQQPEQPGLEKRFIGTYLYAAPERLGSEPVTTGRQIDIYSLGLVMYELFTLRPAYPQTDKASLVAAIKSSAPAAPEIVRHPAQGKVPKEYADIIRIATARAAKHRYTTALEFRDDLQKAIDGTAPVVCVCTGMKRGLTTVDYWVNNYAYLLVVVVILWSLAPLATIGYFYLTHR